MTTNISLLGMPLTKNQLFKFKYNGKTIYVKTGFVGGFGGTFSPIVKENSGVFFKIKDLDYYKKDPVDIKNIEFFPIKNVANIDGKIEVIEIYN